MSPSPPPSPDSASPCRPGYDDGLVRRGASPEGGARRGGRGDPIRAEALKVLRVEHPEDYAPLCKLLRDLHCLPEGVIAGGMTKTGVSVSSVCSVQAAARPRLPARGSHRRWDDWVGRSVGDKPVWPMGAVGSLFRGRESSRRSSITMSPEAEPRHWHLFAGGQACLTDPSVNSQVRG
eukprot:1186732-Prorocentrum_minimum.AAC.1